MRHVVYRPPVPAPRMRLVRPGRLLACRNGATALEFAFVAPVVILLMLGIIEFSMIMFTTSVMESATSSTARLGKTGYTAPGSSRQQQITASILAKTANLLNPHNLTITTRVYSSFPQVGDPEPYTDTNHNGVYNAGEPYSDINGNGHWDADMGTAGLGNANDIVVYTVTYPWPIMTPYMRPFLGSTFLISVRAVVKNEPYNLQYGT